MLRHLEIDRSSSTFVSKIGESELIIDLHMDRTNLVETAESIAADDIEVEEFVPETQEDKINVLLDLFKEKNLVTLTKYIKVFNQGSCQILGIAHAKMNSDFQKIFKRLQLKPDEEEVKHVKSFTKPNGDQMSGKGSMVTTSCKVFHIKKFSREFQLTILNLFNMDPIDDGVEENAEDALPSAASQDFPQHTQSRTMNTYRICSICKFKTRILVNMRSTWLLIPNVVNVDCISKMKPHCNLTTSLSMPLRLVKNVEKKY